MINYIEGNKINYARLLTDEVLAVDKLLVEAAKKNMDVAGIYNFHIYEGCMISTRVLEKEMHSFLFFLNLFLIVSFQLDTLTSAIFQLF